jgi:hypothetical protein
MKDIGARGFCHICLRGEFRRRGKFGRHMPAGGRRGTGAAREAAAGLARRRRGGLRESKGRRGGLRESEGYFGSQVELPYASGLTGFFMGYFFTF